jgi:hypothetical protein
LAVALWVLGIALGFVIPPQSKFLCVPDALLLIGFWPFLVQLRARLLWLFFGIFNTFIGFTLLVVKYLPDDNFKVDPKVLAVKVHLAQYHEPFAWISVGIISAVIGVIRVLLSVFIWLSKRGKQT